MTPQSFSVGSIECVVLEDGHGLYTPEHLFVDVPAEEILPHVDTDAEGRIRLPYSCLLVRSADRVALIDTGIGQIADEAGFPAGKLRGSLDEAGVRPEEISIVVITHAHPDHVGGMVSLGEDGGRPVFSEARHYFWRDEWEFWTSEENLAQVPDILAEPVRACLPPVGDAGLVELVDAETDVLPGVRLIPAPGHTPGHMAVAITSAGDGVLYLGDTVMHELNFANPEWLSVFDAVPNVAISTRRRLLERAVRERMSVIPFHVGRPGAVSKDGSGFRFSAQEL